MICVPKWNPKLMADPEVESIPANEDDFIALVVARDDYKNRVDPTDILNVLRSRR